MDDELIQSVRRQHAAAQRALQVDRATTAVLLENSWEAMRRTYALLAKVDSRMVPPAHRASGSTAALRNEPY